MITLSDQRKLADKASFDALLRRRFAGNVESFLDSLDAGMNHLLRKDLTEAKDYVLAASSYCDFLPPQHEARIISLEARYDLWTGDYRTALKIYRRALSIFRGFRNFEAAARLRKGLIDVHMYLGQYREAIKAGRTAARYFRSRGLTVDLAQCMTNIGNVYHRMDKNHLALQYYDKARKVFAREGGVPLAIVDYNRANVHTNLGNLRQAKSMYIAAAAIYRKAGMEIAEYQSKYAVAYLLLLETRYSEALVEFERVYDAFTRLGDEKAAAITMLDMAEMNIQLNQYGSAIMLGESAASKFERYGMTYEQGKSYFFVAIAKLELGDHKHAADKLSRAERLFIRENNVNWVAMVKHARARLLQAKNRHAAAERMSADAVRLFVKTGDVRRKTDAQLTRLESLGILGRSREFGALAGRLKRAKLAEYQQHVLQNILGDFHFRQARYEEALSHYKSAIIAAEKMISGLFPDEVRFLFAAARYDTYLNAMECYLRLGRVARAFLSNLQWLSSINGSPVTRAKLNGVVPPDLLAAIDRLRATLHRLEHVPQSETRGTARADTYVTEENRLWYYERKARMHLYPNPAREDRRPSRMEERRISVPRGSTLVSYVAKKNLLGAFVCDSTATRFVSLGTSPGELRGTIRKLTFILERSVSGPKSFDNTIEIANSYLERLHELIIEPIEPLLEGKRLILLTEGDLNQVPFPALIDRRKDYLKNHYEIRHAARPEDVRCKDSETGAFSNALNAIFGAPSDSLPFVAAECKAIERSFPESSLFLGDRATRNELTDQLENAGGFIHIAAHAARSCENPLFSRILLSDGPFFPFDLFGSGIRARLVTISGCQTAAPGLYYGNSFSLAKAFHKAGARHVLASLWTVTDEITMLFMTEFYNRLSECNDVVASYHHAVDKTEEATHNPAHWSSFVLLGA